MFWAEHEKIMASYGPCWNNGFYKYNTYYSHINYLSIHKKFIKFDVFTAVTMKNAVFLDVTPCGSCNNRHNIFRRRRRLLVMANVVPSSPIFVTLKMEALLSSETSVDTRATRLNIPENGIPHKQCMKHWMISLKVSNFHLIILKGPPHFIDGNQVDWSTNDFALHSGNVGFESGNTPHI
jgi:hypothetical protein